MSANIPTYYEQSNNYHRVERQTWRERSGHGREEIWEKHGSILSKTGVGFHPILLPNMGIGDCFYTLFKLDGAQRSLATMISRMNLILNH